MPAILAFLWDHTVSDDIHLSSTKTIANEPDVRSVEKGEEI